MENKTTSSLITLPGAIIIAGAIIAIAIIWVNKPASSAVTDSPTNDSKQREINMKPISSSDHILGDPKAPIKIVEYSDPSCPFCKIFNPIMVKLLDEYGPTGKVAWIYRNFPLDKHPNASNESQALECAGFIGGNTGFWAFEKHLYDKTPAVTGETPDGLDQSTLPTLAKDVGIDPKAFSECLTSGRFKSKVEADYLDGINAGVDGTPYSIIITPSGSKIPLVGARDYKTLKSAIDTILNNP